MTTTAFTNGSTLTDASWFNDVDAVTYPLTSVSGTNTVTASGPSGFSAYAAGQVFKFVPAATNTGAVSLNISAAGAKNIYYRGAALGGGEIRQNVPAVVIYDGTQFNLVDSNGVYPTVISVGGAAPATSGAGITFPATQSASSNGNTLDDYEEGTWTVTINGTNAGAVGKYMKVGRMVCVTFNNISGIAAISDNAEFTVTGLPFNLAGSGYEFGGACSMTFNDESDAYKDRLLAARVNSTASNSISGTNRSGVATTTSDPFNLCAWYTAA